MKSFVLKTIVFSFLCVLCSCIITILIFKTIDTGDYYKIDAKYKNVVFGHSHTECAFNDKIIENTLNLSNGGESEFYTYFKIKKILDNNKVENIFLSFSNNQINESRDGEIWNEKYLNKWYTKYGAFLGENDMEVLIKHNPIGFIKTQPITIKNYLTFLIKKDKSIVESESWGRFNYLRKNKIDSILRTIKKGGKSKDFICSKINLDYIRKIVDLCKEKGVRLYFVRCPVYKDWQGLKNEFFFHKILREKFQEVSFLDFKDFPLRRSNFADEHHLNYLGSSKFSIFFNQLMENGLISKKNKQKFINDEMKKKSL